jgi:hypothetical protein
MNHCGVLMSKTSRNGKRKRKQRLKRNLKETLQQVLMVKNDGPMAKDVVKAAANVKGAAVTYNQGYRAIKAQDKVDVMSNNDSYEVIIPYLHQFQENNPGLEVHYDLIDGKIDSLFLCPSIMNACLQFVRPVMSLDATHLKSSTKKLCI